MNFWHWIDIVLHRTPVETTQVFQWSNFSGSAIIAAIVSGIISIIALIVNVLTNFSMHKQKLKNESELLQRKTDADITLSERKFNLDRDLADWKRKSELAEQVLADFYKVKDIFISVRSPFSYSGEGSTRQRGSNEDEEETKSKDALYSTFERLTKHQPFLSEIHARRFQFMALFGRDCDKPFFEILNNCSIIQAHTYTLIRGNGRLSQEERHKYEVSIGWAGNDDHSDPILEKINEAVAKIEAICKPVLLANPQDQNTKNL